MAATTRDEALREHPELANLELLKDAGWRFQPLADENGEPLCLVGFHHVGPYTDAIYLYDVHDSLAVRLLGDQPGWRGGMVWRYAGRLVECVRELLALPTPTLTTPLLRRGSSAAAPHLPRLM
ncbi:hypothetical protein LX83_003421 [Goodfellowiella coeruleoviolacea]|uniref:Uncharacterized protein n=1 Tax=Goodfellowiella coeruleoviolacea TaxID=334858 RepID=A0AAE3KLH5_9PSEU|nr:hypothetical protein [Goodfellowiella coeruleoviolacea]